MDYNIGFRILIVDDEIEYQRVFSYILSEKGYTVETCSNGIEAVSYTHPLIREVLLYL